MFCSFVLALQSPSSIPYLPVSEHTYFICYISPTVLLFPPPNKNLFLQIKCRRSMNRSCSCFQTFLFHFFQGWRRSFSSDWRRRSLNWISGFIFFLLLFLFLPPREGKNKEDYESRRRESGNRRIDHVPKFIRDFNACYGFFFFFFSDFLPWLLPPRGREVEEGPSSW